MSTRKGAARAAALVIALLFASASAQDAGEARSAVLAQPQDGPDLGVPATPEQIAGWDISIGAEGEGLPPGSGTALAGAAIYAQKCLACHGAEGAGQPNDRLAGGHGSLTDDAPVRTIGSYWPYATTVFDYVRRAMPYTQPQSLTDDEVYALTAYLLHVNGIVGERDEMSAETLPQVVMPNRGNFTLGYPDWPASR